MSYSCLETYFHTRSILLNVLICCLYDFYYKMLSFTSFYICDMLFILNLTGKGFGKSVLANKAVNMTTPSLHGPHHNCLLMTRNTVFETYVF